MADRKEELERRLAQSRRLASGANDPTTTERLMDLIHNLEQEQAQPPNPNISSGEMQKPGKK
jgi:CRP-like cAMP-binding protein